MNVEAVSNHIANWLKNYSEKARTKGFVVGVSGGIDSAVTSALAARTDLKVLCLEMPIHQTEAQISRASKHIDMLMENHPNVTRQLLNLTEVFDAFVAKLPKAESTESAQLSLVNARARLRMTTLYYFAQLHGYLVAGTGNKVEDFGVGFFTKYGDGGVDLSPIADLTKTEVYALGKHLGVIEEILAAPPTDGLWGDDRTDEDQIGASYPELEKAMKAHEEGKSAEDFSGRDKEVMEIYLKLHKANRHKMEPIPVCRIPEKFR